MAKILTVSRKKPSPHGLSNSVSCSKDDKHQHMVKFSCGFPYPFFSKAFFRQFFSNSLFFWGHPIIKLLKITQSFLLRLADLKSEFTLTLCYLNPVFNYVAQVLTNEGNSCYLSHVCQMIFWSLSSDDIRDLKQPGREKPRLKMNLYSWFEYREWLHVFTVSCGATRQL